MNEQTNPMMPTDVPTSNQMPPPVQSPPSVVPPPKPASSMRAAWIALVGIVVLAGAYAAYAKYASVWPFVPRVTMCTMDAKICPDGTAVGRTGPNCEFAACPGETPDPTVGWKTYTNTQYGFELKLPASWENYEVTLRHDDLNSLVELWFAVPTKEFPDGFDGRFVIAIYTPEGWAKALKEPMGGAGRILFQNSNYVFNVFYSLEAPASDTAVANDDVDQILSTFKFTR